MCGRYYIDDGIDANELREIIDEVNRHSNADQVKTSGEVFPTDTVPIIANSRAMVPSAFAMSWGYSLPDGKRIINARSETAEEKAMFRDGMAQRRCVVPATNYFEWERAGNRKRSMLYARQAMASCTWPVSIAWKMVGQYSRY